MTEEALVKRLKEGDKASFDLLYEKYKNMALHTAYLITGDLPGSEDIVQDTFVKVWLHCRELKDEGGFKAWMMQILVRTAYRSGKRKSRELPDEDIRKITATYHAFVGGTLENVKGFCAVVTTQEIAKQDYILTPGRYVGIEEQEDDGEPFDEKMKRLTSELSVMFAESHELEEEIRKKLGAIGYEI